MIVPFRFYTTRIRKFQKNSKKIQKTKQYYIMASLQAKIGWKTQKKRKNKNYRSVPFRHSA